MDEKLKGDVPALEAKTEESKIESEPKVNLKFFYAAHGMPNDWKALENLIPASDVYAIESLGWEERDRKLYESVSEGTMDLDSVKKIVALSPIEEKEFQLLYNSHKSVVLVDVPNGHPLLAKEREKEKEFNSRWEKSQSSFRSGKFDEALTEKADALRLFTKRYQEREKYIAGEIRALVSQLKKSTGNKDINVLVRIGTMHSLMSRNLEKDGIKSERAFSDPVMLFTFGEEAVRRLAVGENIPPEVIAASLMEGELTGYMWNLADTSESCLILTRDIVSKLTFDDIKHISSALQQGKRFISEIEARGIKVPKTKEEAAGMMKELSKKWGPRKAKNQDLPEK